MAAKHVSSGRRKGRGRKWILIVLILGAVAGGGYFIWQRYFRPAPMEEFMPEPVMETAVRTDIERLYSGNGKIISGEKSDIASGIAGDTKILVSEVFVKIGDKVSAGDVLYTLDLSSVENEIAIQQQKAKLQEQLEAVERQAASRALANAQYASGSQYQSATTTLARSAEDTDADILVQVENAEDLIKYQEEERKAKEAFDAANAWYEQVKASRASMEAQWEGRDDSSSTLTNELSLLQAEMTYKRSEWERTHSSTLQESVTTDGKTPSAPAASTESFEDTEEYKRLQQAINEKAYSLAQSQYNRDTLNNEKDSIDRTYTEALEQKTEKETAYELAKSKRETAEEAYKTGKTTVRKDARAMEDLIPETDKNNREVLNAEAAARESIETSRLNGEIKSIDTAEEIRKKQELLEKGVITADMDGIVTGIRVVAGQSYTGSDAITLQDMDHMKVVAEIDEAHIADIQVGMKARIRTDSTGDEPIAGTVVFTSPTPTETVTTTTDGSKQTQTAAVSNAKATYRVEIALNEKNERLRVGMTAKIDFILMSAENVIAVPNSCVTTYPDGTSFVRMISQEEAAPAADPAGEDIQDNPWIPDSPSEGTGPEVQEEPAAAEGEENLIESFPSREVQVTTGISDDYYTEITSGNIREGDMLEGESAAFDPGSAGLLDGIYN